LAYCTVLDSVDCYMENTSGPSYKMPFLVILQPNMELWYSEPAEGPLVLPGWWWGSCMLRGLMLGTKKFSRF